MAELGPTVSCRHVPRTAYASSGASAAKRPVSGGMPASDAYAMPSGTRTAHTAAAAIRSGRSQRRS